MEIILTLTSCGYLQIAVFKLVDGKFGGRKKYKGICCLSL